VPPTTKLCGEAHKRDATPALQDKYDLGLIVETPVFALFDGPPIDSLPVPASVHSVGSTVQRASPYSGVLILPAAEKKSSGSVGCCAKI
jgi:hypothetical protein